MVLYNYSIFHVYFNKRFLHLSNNAERIHEICVLVFNSCLLENRRYGRYFSKNIGYVATPLLLVIAVQQVVVAYGFDIL